MEGAALILAVVLALASVAFVARPFLREPEPEDDHLAETSPAEQERMRLAEQRDRALAALKELEFDHRTGKVSDSDYKELVGPLRRQAAAALEGLEPRRGAKPERADRVDARA